MILPAGWICARWASAPWNAWSRWAHGWLWRPHRLARILDRILAVSGSHFRAVESGQMSLFGAHTGVVEDITLPPVTMDISRREF